MKAVKRGERYAHRCDLAVAYDRVRAMSREGVAEFAVPLTAGELDFGVFNELLNGDDPETLHGRFSAARAPSKCNQAANRRSGKRTNR